MLNILKELGVDWRDRRLIMNLYLHQKAVVKVMQDYSEECEIGRLDVRIELDSIRES